MIRKATKLFLFLLLFLFILGNANAQNNCDCWKTPDNTWSIVPFNTGSPPDYRNDDGSTSSMAISFTFCFWGTPENSFYINNNGNISFSAPFSTFTPATFPLSSYDMLAPFWADVDTRTSSSALQSGVVHYKITPTYVIVQWDTVGYYAEHDSLRCSFQCTFSNGSDPIIPYGNNVEFCYKQMQWTTGDASGGHGGFHGSPATVGANRGNGVDYVQFGLFDTSSTYYAGQFPPGPSYDGVWWLDNKVFMFNACSNRIPPIVSGVSPCDTFRVCIGDTAKVNISFLSPKATDSCFSALGPPVPSGVSIISNTPGNTDSMTVQMIGNASNYGFNTVTVYGWDNENPHDTTFVKFVLEVDSSAQGTISASRDTICPGDSVVIKVNATPHNYLWSNGATIDSIKVSPAATTTYTCTVSKGNCSLNLTQTITVLNGGFVTVTKDTVCPGDSTTLTVHDVVTFTWSTGATTSSITVAPDSNTTYKVYCGSGGCGNDTLTKRVYLYAIPVVTLSGNDSICVGSNTTITATGGGTYHWSTGSTNASITVSPAATTTYTLAVSNGHCPKDTSVTVTVIPPPTASITVQPNDTICKGDSALLIANGGTKYVWAPGGATTDSIWVKDTVTTTHTVTVTGFHGCPSATATVKIFVYPQLTVVMGSPQATCPGGTVTLKATAHGGNPNSYNYSWAPGGATTSSVTLTPATTQYYTVTLTDNCPGQIVVDSVKVTVDPIATVNFKADTMDGCWPLCVSFKDLSTIPSGNITGWAWNFGNGTNANIQNPTGCYPAAGIYNVSLTVTTDSGCTSSDTIKNMITVYSHPNAQFTTSPNPATIALPLINFTDQSTDNYGIVSWLWNFGDFSDNTSSLQNPQHTYSDTGTYCVNLTVTNKHGCVDSITNCLVIEPAFLLYIPDAFTPNADGRNDVFMPKGKFVYNYNMYIFDRWGTMIFHSSDINTGWNGTLNGKVCQEDTYVYLIECTDNHNKKYSYLGRLTLAQ